MASKKHHTHATPSKSTKHRPSKATSNTPTKDDPLRAEAPEQAEPSLSAVTESGAKLTPESSTPLASPPAEAETRALERTLPQPTEKVRKLSALDAAAKVLHETGQAMSCPELIAAMAAKGYWTSPQGKTPASTLYAAVQRELKNKGEKARFCKTDRGRFTLRAGL
jgi:hypothetical protein